ncbi:MAG TPA: DMT family transporter, partial [Candidatus Limnocylindria bacterium]
APASRTLNPAAHLRGVLLVLGAALGFATLGPLSGIAYRAGMGSPTFVTLRALVGASLLALIVLREPTLRVPLRGLLRREQLLLGTAVVANACLNLALFAAYGQMAVALVLAVYFTYPMLVALGSVAIGRERFTLTRSAGLLLAGIGLALVMADQVGGAGSSVPVLGLAFALAAATCQASYLVVSRAGYTRVPAEQATALMLAGGALLAGVVALAADLPAGRLLAWTDSWQAWGAVLATGILGAAAAKVWLLRGVRLLGATRTAVLMLTEPVCGVLLAALVLSQAVTLAEAVGGAIILAAAFLVQRPAPGRVAVSS